MIRSNIKRILVLASTLIGVAALTIPSAQADQRAAGSGDPVLFNSTNPELRNLRNGATYVTCDAHMMEGEASIPAVSIYQHVWENCQTAFTPVSLSVGTPWAYNDLGPTSTPGIRSISITDIELMVSGPGCSATLSGSVPGVYNSVSSVMSLGWAYPDPSGTQLLASNVSGCFGVIVNGDELDWRGDYDVTPPL